MINRIVQVALSKNGRVLFNQVPMLEPTAETRNEIPINKIKLWKLICFVLAFASSAKRDDTASSSVVSAFVHLLNFGARLIAHRRNTTQSE